MWSPIRASGHPKDRPLVAQLLASADAHDELRHLTGCGTNHNDDAEPRDEDPRTPSRYLIILQAARHAEKAGDIKRHEHHVETDEREPERGLSPAFVQLEPERLGKPNR